ncbi:Fc.00g024210.m01.CDS01 [Cosmosporella sp. VM-42]
MSLPICRTSLGLSNSLQENIRTFKTMDAYRTYPEKYLTSKSVSTGAINDGKTENFNALGSIDIYWTLRSIAFASQGGKLTGLLAIYTNGPGA